MACVSHYANRVGSDKKKKINTISFACGDKTEE